MIAQVNKDTKDDTMNELDGFEVFNQFFSAPLLNINCLIKASQTLNKDMKDRDQNKQTIRGIRGS